MPNNKKRSWKVIYRKEKAGKRKVTTFQEADYFRLGLNKDMDFDTAHSICQSLNSDENLKAIQEKRNIIAARIKEEELSLDAVFPPVLLREFENTQLDLSNNKEQCHWRAAKRLIAYLKNKFGYDVADWHFNKNQIYKYFQSKTWSFSHAQKILIVMNKWGKFYSYKRKSFFEALTSPVGVGRQRLTDIHFKAKGSTKSNPLTVKLLESKRNCFVETQYNWLYLSVWLGLRPHEVDLLKKPPGEETWHKEPLADNPKITVLWVYQSKLTSLPREERYKPIPLKCREQVKCLGIIEQGNFERPLVKTLNNYFSTYINCMGGRKAFTDLMLENGNSIEATAQYMGHRNINRTWISYKNKKKVLMK